MSNRHHPDQTIAFGQLIDDPKCSDAERAKSPQATPKRVPCEGFTLEPSKRFLDRVDKRPTQLEQIAPCRAREDDARHRSASSPEIGQLSAEVLQVDRLTTVQVSQPGIKRREGFGIGEDLRGLLQRLIFVDRNDRSGWATVTGHEQMLASFRYIVDEATEIAPELADRNGLGHSIKRT